MPKKKKSKKVNDPEKEARELLRKDCICQVLHLATEIDAENKTKVELTARLVHISQFWDMEKKHLEVRNKIANRYCCQDTSDLFNANLMIRS